MKRKLANAIVSLVCVFALITSAQAYTFDQVDTEFWVGEGANEALLVIDYNGYGGGSDGGPSFAFGYRWDGDATGLDLFEAMNTDGRLAVTHYDTNSGSWYYQIGFAYDGFDYSWYQTYGTPFRGGYSDDGESWDGGSGGSFGSMKYGLDTIDLVDGRWFGYNVNSPSFLAPDIPEAAPVPIPGAVWLLGSGIIGLAGFRRRRNR